MRFFLGSLFLLLAQTSFAASLTCESLFRDLSKHETALVLASKAGLHYASNSGPAYHRLEAPSEGHKKHFIYLDDSGHEVTDPRLLNRFDSLKIPPGYHDVRIDADPLAHIQVRGRDNRERPQYRYHELWNTDVRDAGKFTRMHEFGKHIAEFRLAIAADLDKPVLDRDSQLAAVSRLLETSGIRIGGEKYAQGDDASFGLTTLLVGHVRELKSPFVRFEFIAKEGIPQNIRVEDPAVARVIEAIVKGKSSDQQLFDVSAAEVNQYIKSHMGSAFSAKDFRTWVGTSQAAEVLMRDPSLPPEKAFQLASVEASGRLHNTPQIAASAYIDPELFQAYLEGRILIQNFSDPRLSDAENLVLSLKTGPL